jgi:hypothetical protein
MDFEKSVGYFLLFLGVAMMLSSLLMVFNVFTGATKPPALFNIQKQKSSGASIAGIEMPSIEVLPPEYLNLSGNLSFYMAFMFFIAYVGGKISGIGVSMTKDAAAKKQN